MLEKTMQLPVGKTAVGVTVTNEKITGAFTSVSYTADTDAVVQKTGNKAVVNCDEHVDVLFSGDVAEIQTGENLDENDIVRFEEEGYESSATAEAGISYHAFLERADFLASPRRQSSEGRNIKQRAVIAVGFFRFVSQSQCFGTNGSVFPPQFGANITADFFCLSVFCQQKTFRKGGYPF